MASNNILNSLRSSTLANALAEVASASDVQLYETAIGMSAIKGVSANTSVLPPQSVSVATTVTSGQVYTINIPRNGWLHGVVVKINIDAAGTGTNTLTPGNGGSYPHLTDCSIIRGGQVIMPMNGAAALCSFSKYLEGNACDRLLSASIGNEATRIPDASTDCYLLIPFDFMYDKSLALDTLYCEQLQLRLSFNTSAFGVQSITTGVSAFGACSVIFHYFDLDPDVANQLRQKVYAQSEAHSFLSNGWYQYPAVASATAVNLNSQNLVKHIFYINSAVGGALSTLTGSHTVSAGGQTLQLHENAGDMQVQRVLFNPKSSNSSNALSALIGCFDFTNAQNTESDAYSSGLSLRNIADPRLTPSAITAGNYIVVECYYNLVSISSAGGQVMVSATS
jgi:hypothetical protein